MREVLVVDDEAPMRAALEVNLRRQGWAVQTAGGVQEAVAKFRVRRCPLVLTDMRMRDGDGLGVLRQVRAIAPETAVILLTAYGSVPDAVTTIREGACDYLEKPVAFEQLDKAIQRVLALPPATEEVVGSSPQLRRLLNLALRVARTDTDVLVEAESGTGKELLARLLHRNSPRKDGPFIAVNCAALPEPLLESELFGYVRGAFTGAMNTKLGKFELADRGTLLLDEIGEMPMSLQPKLLRVLQDRQVDRLGDTRPSRVNARVIATTNRSLQQLVTEGKFRADLYYRLNVVPLTIPPLRQRPADIVELAEHFIAKYAAPGTAYALSPELRERLIEYSWPGNVRELENLIRRALVLSPSPVLGAEVLGEVIPPMLEEGGPAGALQPGAKLKDVGRQLFEMTLASTGGNRSRTAQLLGVSIRTVRNKIREYGLQRRNA
jgi:DNA-binding NtrC family response regulator